MKEDSTNNKSIDSSGDNLQNNGNCSARKNTFVENHLSNAVFMRAEISGLYNNRECNLPEKFEANYR